MDEKAKKIFDQLGDFKVSSIAWIGDDFRLTLLRPYEYKEKISLVFIWATKVKIHIDFDKCMGEPLLFSSELVEVAKDTYKVVLDFGGDRNEFISFECCNIFLE